MSRGTLKKIEQNKHLIAIEDVPNAIRGWYAASKALNRQRNVFKEALRKNAERRRKLDFQIRLDSLFKQYIRQKYTSVYWEAVTFLKEKDCQSIKDFDKTIKELKGVASKESD